jgi:hypothetical protein
MAYSPSTETAEEILARLSRIERKLDEMHTRLKAVELNVKRVKREVRS